MMRFLCLHGAYTNPEAMKERLEPILDAVTEGGLATFHYARAPLEGPPTSEMQETMGLIPDPPHYRWTTWERLGHCTTHLPTVESLNAALEHVEHDIIPTAGPFDALLGFSEGAMLAVQLARQHPKRYRCVILFSGFMVRDDKGNLRSPPHDPTELISTPSLHVIGARDPMNEAVALLYSFFDSDVARLVQHDQAHTIPAGGRNIERISRAIKQLIEETAED